MQRRGRRGDRALLAREHGLVVARGRARRRRAGRRYRAAAASARRARAAPRPARRRRNAAGPSRPSPCSRDRGGDAGAEIDAVAGAQPPGVADEGAPGARPLALVQGGADPRLAAPAFELGGDDAGVVEHQHVAAPQQRRQIEDGLVGDASPVDQQQPRRIARARGPQRDPVGRELEIEKVDAH